MKVSVRFEEFEKDMEDDDSMHEIDEVEMLSRKKRRTGKGKNYESWHETSETEIAFNGDHGESDESMDHPSSDHPDGSTDDEVAEDEDSKSRSTFTVQREKFRKVRHVAGKFVNNEHFQTFIIVLICINAIMMGIATFDYVQNDPQRKDRFEKTDKAFLVVFTIELAFQFLYHGLYLFKDGWLIFDFIIIVISWAFDSLQIIRAFRIFRALRLITRLEVLRNLVTALFAVMPRMTAISALLLLVFYIYAVLCTYLFRDLFRDGKSGDIDYFSRLDYSLFTLFQIMTLEDWGEVARLAMAEYRWAWMVFVSYVAATAFIVYNLIIAVVCDAVAVIEHDGVDEAEGALAAVSEEEGSDSQSEAPPKYRAEIDQLNNRLDDLADQQRDLLKALEDALKELESMDERRRSTFNY